MVGVTVPNELPREYVGDNICLFYRHNEKLNMHLPGKTPEERRNYWTTVPRDVISHPNHVGHAYFVNDAFVRLAKRFVAENEDFDRRVELSDILALATASNILVFPRRLHDERSTRTGT